MQASATLAPLVLVRRLSARIDPPALSAWTLSFTLVAYLALRGGGFDLVVRSEVGAALWWIVLLGAIAGLIPGRLGQAGWASVGLLAGFAAWTGLASGWSLDSGAAIAELGRIATYLGALVLALAVQGRTTARHSVTGLAAAVGLVTAVAVLSRLHPQAFPSDQHLQFLGAGSARKLSYPLNYWNALAAFAALGAPLLVAVAVGARTVAGQALAAAALPLSGLCVYLTLSRGGAVALVVGLVVLLAVFPRRLEAIATLVVAAAGAAILIWAVSRHPALTTGIPTRRAIDDGGHVLRLAIVVCAGVGLLQAAVGLSARYLPRPRLLAPDRRATARRAAALLAVGLVAAVAAGVPGTLSRTWHDFKQPLGVVTPHSETTIFDRLSAANGNSRYQYWQSAVDANATDPLKGIGPGTFQYWWAQHGTTDGFVRNAHSLYFETLAETGIVGLALIAGLLAVLFATAVRRTFATDPETRIWIAGATGGLGAFAAAAAVEWVWQFAAIAAAVLVLGAVVLAGGPERAARPATPPPAPARRPRAVLGLLAVVGLVAIAVPLAGELALRSSQSAARTGDLRAAYGDSLTAQRIEPDAAAPRLQQALVLESAGELGAAARAARAAAARAPVEWQIWVTLARIDARRGATAAALFDLRTARRLNPRSPLFRTP